MCVRLRVCRSNTGLSSHMVSLKLSDDVCRGEAFADVRERCHRGCQWRCNRMRVRVGINPITPQISSYFK